MAKRLLSDSVDPGHETRDFLTGSDCQRIPEALMAVTPSSPVLRFPYKYRTEVDAFTAVLDHVFVYVFETVADEKPNSSVSSTDEGLDSVPHKAYLSNCF